MEQHTKRNALLSSISIPSDIHNGNIIFHAKPNSSYMQEYRSLLFCVLYSTIFFFLKEIWLVMAFFYKR